MATTARVYVDGFNFYHGAIKRHRGRRWLNFWTFAERLIPAGTTLDEVHYFTTRIHSRPNDPDGPERQATYLRALESLDGVFVHEGKFKSKHKQVVLVDPQPMSAKRENPKGHTRDSKTWDGHERRGHTTPRKKKPTSRWAACSSPTAAMERSTWQWW